MGHGHGHTFYRVVGQAECEIAMNPSFHIIATKLRKEYWQKRPLHCICFMNTLADLHRTQRIMSGVKNTTPKVTALHTWFVTLSTLKFTLRYKKFTQVQKSEKPWRRDWQKCGGGAAPTMQWNLRRCRRRHVRFHVLWDHQHMTSAKDFD